LQKEVRQLENKVADLTIKRDALENDIAIMVGDGKGHQLKDMNIMLSKIVKELEVAESAWIEAQERLEAAK
jgi:ATP-binding cassette subfamily F protein 3